MADNGNSWFWNCPGPAVDPSFPGRPIMHSRMLLERNQRFYAFLRPFQCGFLRRKAASRLAAPRHSFAGFVLAAVLGAAVAVTAPSILSQQAPAPGAPATQPGHEHHWPKPTNLKVLPKDTSPEQLHKVMEGIAGSLGVHCSFCHVQNQQTRHMDFASDAKPDKHMARIMMRMTQTINTQYLSQIHDPDAMPEDQHVSCGTCHQGHKMPPHFVPPPEHHGPPPMGNMPKPGL
jgi:hypothetical protein